MDTIKFILFPLVIAIVLLLGAIEDQAKYELDLFHISKSDLAKRPFVPLQFEPVKDTIYVLGDAFVKISLDSQIAHLFLRSGEKYEFKISSGNANIHKGINTAEGVFTVQSKSEKAISKQFNNAELFYWVGFNGNIGFHGLSGTGYYGYLGNRPSSHGCVRIGREDGKKLYREVTRGTPVLVYSSDPARTLAFAEWEDYARDNSMLISESSPYFSNLLQKRLENLYAGDAYIKNRSKVFLDGKTILKRSSIKVGRAEKIAHQQKLPLYNYDFTLSAYDKLKLRKIVFDFDSTGSTKDTIRNLKVIRRKS